MGNKLILLSYVCLPMCIGFFFAEPIGMPHVVVTFIWISMFISGVVYDKFPMLNNSKWTTVHFWFHSMGLPLVIVSFLGYTLGNRGIIQVLLTMGSFPIFGCLLIFFIRLLVHLIRNNKAKS